jgi:hypothetical protein
MVTLEAPDAALVGDERPGDEPDAALAVATEPPRDSPDAGEP